MSSKRQFKITDARSGAAITVRVVAQSARTEVAGLQDGMLKIRLTASAVELPDANQELIAFLAAKLELPPKNFDIVAGNSGRDKIVSIEGMTTAQVEEILLANAVE